MKFALALAFATLAALFAQADVVIAPSTPLLVYTIYESDKCTGKPIQNNYVVAPNGACTKNTTCGAMTNGAGAGFVTGCCTSDVVSTRAYTKETFGSDVDTVTWFIFGDAGCNTFTVASDSPMTSALSTTQCSMQTDGTSKKYTYTTDKSIVSSQFANNDCEGTPINSTVGFADLGKCIPLGSIGIKAYATIDGTTYGASASSGERSSVSALVGAVSTISALWAAQA